MTIDEALTTARQLQPHAPRPHAFSCLTYPPSDAYVDRAEMAARLRWTDPCLLDDSPAPVLWVLILGDFFPTRQAARAVGQAMARRLLARRLGVVPLDVWFFYLGEPPAAKLAAAAAMIDKARKLWSTLFPKPEKG